MPLLAFPFLGRVLGPQKFGLLMLSCLVPPITCLIMDWGLPLGGARAAARAGGNRETLRRILGSALSAKLILAVTCATVAPAVALFLPKVQEWLYGYYLGVLLGLCRGINPFWFFQGAGEKASKLAIWDALSSATALGLVFAFVRDPDDWPDYLLYAAICKGAAYLYLNFSLWRKYRAFFDLKSGFKSLRKTGALFAYSVFAIIYTNISQLVTAYFLDAAQIGLLVAANKMTKAMAAVCVPVTQTVYPEICAARGLRSPDTRRILRFSLGAILVIAATVATAACVCAPLVLRLALGDGYGFGLDAARVVFLAAPFLALEQALAVQILAPLDMENSMAKAGALAACAIPVIGGVLAWAYGLNGAAWTLPGGEFFVCLTFIYLIITRRNNEN